MTSYGSNDVVVTNVVSAVRAIDVITDQGEGSPHKPHDDLDGIQGHYSRFFNIVKQGEQQFSGGQVYPMVDNPNKQNLPDKLEALARFSDDAYVWLLQALERGFNGDARGVGQTVGGLMYQVVQPLAIYLMGQPLDNSSGRTLGPRFQYHEVVTLTNLQQDWQRLDRTYRRDPKLIAVAKVLGLNTVAA